MNEPINNELDNLLSQWHQENRAAAERGRDAIMTQVAGNAPRGRVRPDGLRGQRPAQSRRMFFGTGALAAALFVIVAMLAVLALPTPRNTALAQVVQVPEGGRLEAITTEGELLGPCPLKHTAVDAEVSGPFIRVRLKQQFHNAYAQKIEAVYTFPMSHRGAVDSMIMTITDPEGGERVVIGEVKERGLAREIYENAKASGYVASLLEQERANIFTQSVANIEPGSTVEIDIAYVEVLEARDGEYAFEFPTVVGPRYIPGTPQLSSESMPADAVVRPGVVLRGPAEFSLADLNGVSSQENWSPAQIQAVLGQVVPVRTPEWSNNLGMIPFVLGFNVKYPNDSQEIGYLYGNGYGVIYGSVNGAFNERWFVWRRLQSDGTGDGFSPNTDQVPDASKITPMPVKPPTRAGHDISITVNLDTGGVPITSLEAPLHDVDRTDENGVVQIALKDQKTIPNRDFVLRWRLQDDRIEESIFTHVIPNNQNTLEGIQSSGGYLSMVLAPPARVEDNTVRSRELIFVLDTSGSMRGFPIEKSKQVALKAISEMRPGDTFNVITFAGKTAILWPEPRPASEANRVEAMSFISKLQGGGGTEMMDAINAALVQTVQASSRLSLEQLADLPADGRSVVIEVSPGAVVDEDGKQWLVVRDDLRLPMNLGVVLPFSRNETRDFLMQGSWRTENGLRMLDVTSARYVDDPSLAPLRIAMFFTDGYVGNDQGIIQAIRDNARTTRVFGLGIGNSINRWLLDEMSNAGRGEVEYVLLDDDADEAVERLARRIKTPVLTDIEVSIDGIEVTDILPRNREGLLPDLYDEQPISFFARFTPPDTGATKGVVTITGNTGQGRYERSIEVEFPAAAADNSVIPTLWARAKVDQVLAPHLLAVERNTLATNVKSEVVRLGETYSIMTPYTSFVAVEKSRITIAGRPVLVNVPIELPSGTSWEGFFGTECPQVVLDAETRLRAQAGRPIVVEASTESIEMEFEIEKAMAPDSPAAGTPMQLDSRAGSGSTNWYAAPPPPAGPATYGRSVKGKAPASATRGRSQGGRRSPSSAAGGFGGGGGGRAAVDSNISGQTIARDTGVTESSQDESRALGEATEKVPVETPVKEEAASEQSVSEAGLEEIDLDRIWRTLDRSLLLLALGAEPKDIKALPNKGVDGKPFVFEGTVEVTVLWDSSCDEAEARKAMATAGLSIEGEAASGSVVVGRIDIAKLLKLAQATCVRRIVPTATR
ncbi:MAG: VIT and VWA domain-containing protein [Phycisphaerales bacterium]|nr:VIT and VWA domain-containing protein [Phycisphaerales bacterium]